MLPARSVALAMRYNVRTWLRQTAARVRSVSRTDGFQPCPTAASTDAARLYDGGRRGRCPSCTPLLKHRHGFGTGHPAFDHSHDAVSRPVGNRAECRGFGTAINHRLKPHLVRSSFDRRLRATCGRNRMVTREHQRWSELAGPLPYAFRHQRASPFPLSSSDLGGQRVQLRLPKAPTDSNLRHEIPVNTINLHQDRAKFIRALRPDYNQRL
jgi:hypothetical protein